MCYNKGAMTILHQPVRLLAGPRASGLPCVAALLAMLIVIQPAAAEDDASTLHASPTAASKTDVSKEAASKAAVYKPAPAKQTAENGKPPNPADINQSIARLGSADYHTREQAVRQLIAAGSQAIGPLTKAAQAADLEVSYRAVRVLQSLLDQEDLGAQQQAAAALQSLATGEDYPAADLAADALTLYRLTQQDRALESLRRLGATVSAIGFGDDIEIILNGQWHGKTADLALLKQTPHLNHLRILYVKLDDQALKTLAALTQLNYLDLIGTGISTESADGLTQALPGVIIDRRNGALLGIAPSPVSIGCTVGEVVDGSAASAADIRAGDEIISIDGHAVQRFEELTALIGAKNVGDSAAIELRRDGQLITKQVSLGRWQN